MPTMIDVGNEEHKFYLFKGEPTTRKSTQALSFPAPQYWFSHDKHMNSLVLPMKHWGIKAADIHYDSYSNWMEMENKLKSLQTNCPFKTIIVDSLTSEGDSINEQTIELKAGTTSKDGANKGITIGGISVNSLEDYKAEASAFRDTVSYLKDISNHFRVNVILIAHVVGARPNEQENSSYFTRIIVTGGKVISAKIPAYCDEIYHFYVEPNVDAKKEGEYALITRNNGYDYARTGLVLPQTIKFGTEPLYERWIYPAIKNLKNQQPTQQLK